MAQQKPRILEASELRWQPGYIASVVFWITLRGWVTPYDFVSVDLTEDGNWTVAVYRAANGREIHVLND